MSIEITIKRHHWSKRVRISIGRDGRVTVTMPRWGSLRRVKQFVEEKRGWIEEKVKGMAPTTPSPSFGKEGRRRTQEVLEPMVERYCALYGVTCRRVTIRKARSRWGSCSSKKTLSFNEKLTALPMELVEYVVVHEVCHLREMNHSRAFWALVALALPDFRARRLALKRVDLG